LQLVGEILQSGRRFQKSGDRPHEINRIGGEIPLQVLDENASGEVDYVTGAYASLHSCSWTPLSGLRQG
jgi:hypothetical protein